MVRLSVIKLATLAIVTFAAPVLFVVPAPWRWYYKPISPTIAPTEDPVITTRDFLMTYKADCENQDQDRMEVNLPLCPCLSGLLIGWYNVSSWYHSLAFSRGETETTESGDLTFPPAIEVDPGGHWRPRLCKARQRIAIIIPFRNRDTHLKVFTLYMHSFLQRQLLDYTIFVIEQGSPEIFNRAALMNVGFLEVNKANPEGFDCYIFHDVDLLPENDYNMYTCYQAPIHLGAYMNKFEYQPPYPEFFGGAIGLSGPQVKSFNGFPNKYYGWGGEDDETYSRVLLQNLTVNRYPQAVGRSYMFKHDADDDNPKNPLRSKELVKVEEEYQHMGLSSISYQRDSIVQSDQFTKITVSIKQEYNPKCIVNTMLPPTATKNYVNCLTKDNFNRGTVECCRVHNQIHCCDTMTTNNYYFVLLVCLVIIISGILMYIRKRRGSNCASVIL